MKSDFDFVGSVSRNLILAPRKIPRSVFIEVALSGELAVSHRTSPANKIRSPIIEESPSIVGLEFPPPKSHKIKEKGIPPSISISEAIWKRLYLTR